MKKQLIAVLLLAVIVASTIGYSYACFNHSFFTNHYYCNCGVEFKAVTTSDNENEKDVAAVTAQITIDGKTINVQITNAYPCCEAYVSYTMQNTGCFPIHFISVAIINPNPEALEITTTDHTCTWLPIGETTQGTTTVHILQEAKQNWEYTFQIQIQLTCQTNKPRSTGFWKTQFKAHLNGKGKAQVSANDLEQYLDQISTDSPIFEFTGTRKQKFIQAYKILNPPVHASMEAKLKSQLLALWLNHASSWAGGWTIDGMTALQIIQGSENALLNHQTTQYQYWKNLCERFNTLRG
jgi:hypothetical protein